MLTSIIWAPALDLLARDLQRPPRTPRREPACANLRDPVTLVRSPTFTKMLSGPIGEGLEAAEPAAWRAGVGRDAGREVAHGVGEGADVRGRRAAAPAHEIQQAVLRELAQHLRHLLRRLVVAAELVRQARRSGACSPGTGAIRESSCT